MGGEINFQALLSCSKAPASLSVSNNVVMDQTGSRVLMQYQTLTTTAAQITFNIGNCGCFFAKNLDPSLTLMLALSNDFTGTSVSLFGLLIPGSCCLIPFSQIAKGGPTNITSVWGKLVSGTSSAPNLLIAAVEG